MSCSKFKKYELGKLGEDKFKNHLKGCSSCQEVFKYDEQLMSQAKSLKQPVDAPFLWDRIERSLKEKQQDIAAASKKDFRWRKPLIIPAAAALLLALITGLFFLLRPEVSTQKLLAQATLKKVEKRESQYMRSIEKLEQKVLPKMGNLDIELILLYRDKLETIDSQIEQCKEALTGNPASSHIRQYMIAALLDKKQTLQEILNYQPQIE